MGGIGQIVLSTSALFLALMAILIDSPGLFYMCTAMLVTLALCRLQAASSLDGVSVRRTVPARLAAGDAAKVTLDVLGKGSRRRPWMYVVDALPRFLGVDANEAALPIAPAGDAPIRTHYTMTAQRRGRYEWSTARAIGQDPLGLTRSERDIKTEPTSLLVYPAPLPIEGLPAPMGGAGAREINTGRRAGAGIELQGVRDYVVGDPLKHVHWPSTAKTGQLMVKEFESTGGNEAAIVIQRWFGSQGAASEEALDTLCGCARTLLDLFFGLGARVTFPGAGDTACTTPDRAGYEAGLDVLASARVEPAGTLAAALRELGDTSASTYVLAAHPEDVASLLRAFDPARLVAITVRVPGLVRDDVLWAAFHRDLEAAGALVLPQQPVFRRAR